MSFFSNYFSSFNGIGQLVGVNFIDFQVLSGLTIHPTVSSLISVSQPCTDMVTISQILQLYKQSGDGKGFPSLLSKKENTESWIVGKKVSAKKAWKTLESLSYRNRCIGRLKTEPGLHTDVKMCEETQNFLSLKGRG